MSSYEVEYWGNGWDAHNFRLELDMENSSLVDAPTFITVDRFRLGRPQPYPDARCIIRWLKEGGLESMYAFFKDQLHSEASENTKVYFIENQGGGRFHVR